MAEMPNEANIGGGAFGGSAVDSFVPAPTAGKGDAALTLAQVPKLVDKFSARLDKATAQINAFANALKNATGKTGASPTSATTSGGAIAQAVAASKAQVGSAPIASAAAMGGGGGGFFANMRGGLSAGGGAGYASAANMAMQMGGQVLGAIDARTNSAYPKMLQNDQLAVLYQQTQGISQQQYYNQFRKGLQGARLGAGGINSLLSLQAQTGIQASGQANSIAGLRAATGYAYSTDQMAQMLTTLASPQVNNRMSMTLGTGLYGVGGKQRSMTEVIQSITRGAGLTNARMVQGAMQQGSMTRARLSAMGVPEDMQNMVLQYAQSNLQFQNKTGGKQGMYNPENKSQRQTMGIEANFATQREETTRLSELRDEKYYNRQKDNLATMEQNTQALIKLQTTMEDLASGLIGSRISTRGSVGMRLLKGAAGVAMMGGAAALTIGSGGTASPFAAMLGMAGAGMTANAFTSGDGTEAKSNNKGATVSTTRKTSSSLNSLNTTFRQRLEKMMQDNPNVSVGGGFRSSAQQRTLFLSRYSRTSEKTGTFWDGAYWKKNSGVADAAPPGMSMHEIGLAADLTGDLQWVQQNAAKYGLKTFADVNNEPWHVQPAELPNSRRQYEKAGAPWGTIAGAESFDPNSKFEGMSSDGGVSDALMKSSGGGSGGGGAVPSYSQMSMSEQVSAFRGVGGGGGGGRMSTVRRPRVLGSSSTSTQNSGSVTTGSPMDPRSIAQMLLNRGFKKEDIWNMLAISHRESRWIPSVRNVGPVDDSYGLFQINMKGNLGEARRKYFGIAEDSELFDPKTNVKAARITYGGGNLSPWSVKGDWKNGIDPAKMTQSKQIAQSMNLPTTGDPTTPMRSGGGGTTVVSGGGITIAPNIYIQSAGNNSADAHRAAQEVAKLMTQDLKRAAMRSY
jgi:hypothetical protein